MLAGNAENPLNMLERLSFAGSFGLEDIVVWVSTYPSVLWRTMKFKSPKRCEMIMRCAVLPLI